MQPYLGPLISGAILILRTALIHLYTSGMRGRQRSEVRWRHWARMPDSIVTLALTVFLLGALGAVFQAQAVRAAWLLAASFLCFLLSLYVFQFGQAATLSTGSLISTVVLSVVGFVVLGVAIALLAPS